MHEALKVEVLASANLPDLSPDEYRTIYDELRDGISLDKFCARICSAFTKGTWSRFEREGYLSTAMKEELRRAVGLPSRPLSAAEAVQHIHPLADVVRVSNGLAGPARRVVMLATDGDVTFRWGADGPAVEAQNGRATEAQPAPAQADAQKAAYVPRTRLTRGVSLPARVKTRLNAVRLELGVTWGELMETMLDAYERGKEGTVDGEA